MIFIITKYCVLKGKTLKIILYYESVFFFFFLFILFSKDMLTGFHLFDLQVIKMQKEIGERCREIVLFVLVKNPRGILFLLGEITLQDNSKHLLLVTHGCRVGGVGV